MKSVKTFSALTVMLLAAGCGQPESATDADVVPEVGSGETEMNVTLSQRQLEQWSASCALCHVTGVASAPISGNVEQWQPRLAQGREVLLTNTLEGLNSMPPLGYCMSCEREDFVAMIDFMLGASQ